ATGSGSRDDLAVLRAPARLTERMPSGKARAGEDEIRDEVLRCSGWRLQRRQRNGRDSDRVSRTNSTSHRQPLSKGSTTARGRRRVYIDQSVEALALQRSVCADFAALTVPLPVDSIRPRAHTIPLCATTL